MLPDEQTRAVSALLEQAWGSGSEIRGAAEIWDRSHVLRLQVTTGRSVVLKRRSGERTESFGIELAALEYLNAMPAPVAPRLLAADADAGLLLMEDLGPGATLAGALLAGDRVRATAGLVSYAEALGAMHAWSMARPGEFAGLRARYAPGAPPGPAWLGAVARGRGPFLRDTAALGLPVAGVAAELDELSFLLNGAGFTALVHGDACPDNVRLQADGGRIFDFECSGWGPVVLDAAYLLAPFPSCWCFASLPAEVTAQALEAYRAVVRAAGLELGPDWDAAMAAAVATWIVARGPQVTAVLEEDQDWGTTTMRPRLLAWLGNFTGAAGRAGVLPRLRDLAGALAEHLRSRWPATAVPEYPALAKPGVPRAQVPDWWQPEA